MYKLPTRKSIMLSVFFFPHIFCLYGKKCMMYRNQRMLWTVWARRKKKKSTGVKNIILRKVSIYSAYKWQGFEAKDLKEKCAMYIH